MSGAASDTAVLVVGVDGSDSARDAVGWAADLAAAWGAALRLVHVTAAAPAPGPPPEWLTELVAAAEKAGAALDAAETLVGDPVAVLAERAAEARLLVLGSYGSGARSGMLAGSVALGLMEAVRCPVVVVRGSAPRVPPPRSGPIVVGVDGSSTGHAALAAAAELAVALDARLVAVHTWSDVSTGPTGGLHRSTVPETELAAQAERALDAALGPVTAAHPGLAVDRAVLGDNPLRALLDRAQGARLIVVGHRRLRPTTGMGLGSTSQALVEFAPCPVAVLTPG